MVFIYTYKRVNDRVANSVFIYMQNGHSKEDQKRSHTDQGVPGVESKSPGFVTENVVKYLYMCHSINVCICVCVV